MNGNSREEAAKKLGNQCKADLLDLSIGRKVHVFGSHPGTGEKECEGSARYFVEVITSNERQEKGSAQFCGWKRYTSVGAPILPESEPTVAWEKEDILILLH